MPARYSKYFKIFNLLGDLLVLNLCFLLSYFILFSELQPLFVSPYAELLIYLNTSWVLLVLVFKPYRISRISRSIKIIKNYISLVIIHLLLLTAFFVFELESNFKFSREHIILSYVLFAAFMFFWKFSFTFLLRVLRTKGYNFRKIVIAGYGELAEDLHKFFNLHPEYGFQLLGFFDNKAKGEHILGSVEEIKQYALSNEVDQIYCCLPYVKYNKIKELINFGDNNAIKVKLITDFRGFSFKGLELERYDHIPVINVTAIPLDVSKNKVVKRAFDISFSILVIALVLSWLIPLISLIIMLDSRGPIFFKQLRTGKDNRNFWCWKFRTMHVNGDADRKQATKNDPRITKIGSVLRKTSLDELPQFFNVLKGDMSVVGPRPHPILLNERFSPIIEKFKNRHYVKPGITGLAQAKGFRGETSCVNLMKNRVKLDRFYIENWTMLLDVKIIMLTALSLMKGDENAY